MFYIYNTYYILCITYTHFSGASITRRISESVAKAPLENVANPLETVPNAKDRKSEKFELPPPPKGKTLVDSVIDIDIDTLFQVREISSA